MPCYPLLLPRLRKPSPVAAFWGEQGAPELLLLTQHPLLSFLLALGLFKRHPWPWGAGIVSGYDGGAVGFFFFGGRVDLAPWQDVAPGWQHECNPDFSIRGREADGFCRENKGRKRLQCNFCTPTAVLMALSCLMPHFTFAFHKKNEFLVAARGWAGGGSRDRDKRMLRAHPIDPPWLLQPDPFCIQSTAEFLTPWAVPSRKGGGSRGLQQFLIHPSHAAAPEGVGQSSPEGDTRAPGVVAFPGTPLGPDFVMELAGNRKGKAGGEAEG